MTRFASMVLFGTFTTALAATAVAAPGGPGRLVEALDLDEDQAALVESFKEDMKEARAAVKEARSEFRDSMKEEMSSGDPNVRALQRLAEAKLQAERNAMFLKIDSMAALVETLDEDQLEKLVELQEKREANRGQGPRGHGPRGQGAENGYGPRGR